MTTTIFTVTVDQQHTPLARWLFLREGLFRTALNRKKCVGSIQATNIIQNSFTSLGQGIVGWEPRYDRCKCDGGWPRFRHAFVRNFITYDRSEQSIRPNIMPFAAAFGAGTIAATWNPNDPTFVVKGYQSVITQAWWGVASNVIGEFAPDVMKKLRRHKH